MIADGGAARNFSLSIPKNRQGAFSKWVRRADLANAQARKVYDEAEQIFAEHSRPWSAIMLCMAYANVLAAEERWVESFAVFQESAVLLARAEARFERSVFLQDWAQAHLERGLPEDLERARELYREALSEFEDMGSPGYVARIQVRLDELDG